MAGFSFSGGSQVICLPCEFVDYYMKDADPTFIAVYIFGFRQCFSASPKTCHADVAQSLGILESDVIKAWRYWEKRGVVRLIPEKGENAADFSVEFSDLSGSQPEDAVPQKRPSYKMSDVAARSSEDRALKDMYTYAESMLERPLTQSDTLTLYGLYDWLGLPVEVILMIIEHCVNLGKKTTKYMEAVALDWHKNGICTKEAALNRIEQFEANDRAKRRFKKLLGISGRDLSDTECRLLTEWRETMGFSEKMIKLAYEKTIMQTGKLSFQYMQAILKDWHDAGIKTPDAAQGEAKPKKTVPSAPRTRFSSYSQTGDYSDAELNRLLANSKVTVKEE